VLEGQSLSQAGALDGALVLGPNVLDHLEWGLEVLADVDASAGQKLEALAVTNGVAALFASAGPVTGPEAFALLDARRHARITTLLSAAPPASPAPDLFRRVLEAVLYAILGPSPSNGLDLPGRSTALDRSGRQGG
jgi:hypothetical protein